MISIFESTAALTTKPQWVDERSIATKTSMTTKLTQLRHTSLRQRGSRRSATILVLVMAVLGLLFVAGVAFMATMNFESSIISSERQRNQATPAMQQVMEDTSNLIADLVEPLSSSVAGSSLAQGAAAYVQLPGVHNLTAPIEPHLDSTGRMVWPWVTDLEEIQSPVFIGSDFKMSQKDAPINVGERRWFPLDALNKPGYETEAGQIGDDDTTGDGFADVFTSEYRTLVDADGDGIVDAIEVDLAAAAGGNKRRLAGLARMLNPASKPNGTVKLGLRVVSHNGMVNVNASHPLLIGNVLGSTKNLDPPFYTPAIEEPSLRRRHFLPPEILSLTRLQGSRFNSDLITGGGHYATALFPDKQSPRDHRYWPFSPYEKGSDPIIPLWWLRMDADKADPDPTKDEYDRRHLVTTISYSDLLRRPVMVGPSNDRKDLIDLIIENFPTDAVTRFPLLAYPFSNPSEITETSACINDPDCTLDPRKGRLKLSLAWLDQASKSSGSSLSLISLSERTLLIQDAFTLLLFNARGSEWGAYQSADSSNPNEERTIWVPNYDAIARTAASLTANMIDFADTNDDPTAVAIRSANPNDPNFGNAASTPKEVFGLEIQPFIVEVVANADGQDDTDNDNQLDALEVSTGSNSFFGVELFNPFDQAIPLDNYSLEVAGTTINFPVGEQLNAQEFKGFYSGVLLTSGGTTVKLDKETLVFTDSDTITLVRDDAIDTSFSVVSIVVDQFNIGAGVGKIGNSLLSLQRAADGIGIGRWYAPVPLDFPLASTGVETFGKPNDHAAEGAPVELEFPVFAPTLGGTLLESFPTTGMLLTLMRHANSTKNAFTEALNNFDELENGVSTPTDNGRMPIYDLSLANNGYHAHHIDPNWDMTRMDNSGTFPVAGIKDTAGRAGGAMHLPWGQLVFDYFTVMPLDGPGPYTHDSNGKLIINEDAPPKVDMGGLRVHGQIDLNTAPWKVLEGLPLVAMDQIPVPFRSTFSDILLPTGANSALPINIGDSLAKAIVAYRELRVLVGPSTSDTTGDYSDPLSVFARRGWSDTAPDMRRGTGFMTVGELANVHHPDASFEYRTDSFELDSTIAVKDRSYINSIAVLASLGEWLTVRPQVFTVYGTLRGEEDLTIIDPADPTSMDMLVQDVSSRALRFQETIDRLPAILGEPVRMVGPQIIGKYHDTRGD